MTEYIYEYITKRDYACKHCSKYPPDFYNGNGEVIKDYPSVFIEFFETFKKIREKWGKPIFWNSGYRCPYWNTKIGGEDLSIHLFGLAADLHCLDNEDVEGLFDTMNHVNPGLRIGIYKIPPHFESSSLPWIHFDVGYNIIPRITTAWSKGKRWEKIIR